MTYNDRLSNIIADLVQLRDDMAAPAAPQAPTLFDPVSLKWADVPIGGGGYITQNACDLNTGIMWAGTDVQNCYLRRPGDAKWATVFREDTMHPEDMVRHADMIDGVRITDGLGSNCGTFAGTEGTRAYAAINGDVFALDLDPAIALTETGGIKATRWNLPTKWLRTNQGLSRMWGPGLSGHPTDKAICLLGTENDGAYFTLDGGKTVAQISVPPCTEARARILVWQAEAHSFVFVQGVGLRRSLTGPAGTFELVAGGPLHASCLFGEADGTLWITGDPASPTKDMGIWRVDVGADATFVANPLSAWGGYGPHHIIADPHDPNIITCWMEQLGAISLNRGKTWKASANKGANMVPGGEVEWRGSGPIFAGAISPTPNPGELFWGTGFGTALTQGYDKLTDIVDAKGKVTGQKWTIGAKDNSAGIEEFIVNSILVNPVNGKTWFSCWDRQVVEIVSLTDYVNKPKLPVGAGLSPALSMDVSIDGQFYVSAGGKGAAQHSWSDGGETFQMFDRTYQIFPPKPGTTVHGGSAGAVAVSTRNDIVIVQSNGWPAIETRGRFNPATGLPDRAEDWSVIELNGKTSYSTISAYYVTRQSISADKTRPGVFAMVVPLTNAATGKYDNPLGGLWVRPSTDKPWVQTVQGIVGGKGEAAQFWVCHLNYIPGHPGELLYTGYIGQATCPLGWLKDDGRTQGEMNPDVSDVLAFGFGKGTGVYPAVLFRGKYKGVEAFWLTLDWFKTVQFADDIFLDHYWSAGTPSIAGDVSPDGFGRWIVAIGGKGAVASRLAGNN